MSRDELIAAIMGFSPKRFDEVYALKDGKIQAYGGYLSYAAEQYDKILAAFDSLTARAEAAEGTLREAMELAEKLLGYVASDYTGTNDRDLTDGTLSAARAFLSRHKPPEVPDERE